MAFSSGQLAYAAKALSSYAGSAERVEKIVITHSLAAAGAAAASGCLPGVGSTIATATALAFTLSMYIRICRECDIPLAKNILKAIASVVIAETVSYIVVVLAGTAILTFVPAVGNLGGSIICAIVNFAVVYIAGMLFIDMMVSIFKAKKDITRMSEQELKDYMKSKATRDSIRNGFKEAKKTYKQVRNDKSYNTEDVRPTE